LTEAFDTTRIESNSKYTYHKNCETVNVSSDYNRKNKEHTVTKLLDTSGMAVVKQMNNTVHNAVL